MSAFTKMFPESSQNPSLSTSTAASTPAKLDRHTVCLVYPNGDVVIHSTDKH